MENIHPPTTDPDLKHLETLSTVLDNKFALGGVRFGLDPVVGLIPILGDAAGLLINGVMLKTILKKGASPWILAKMLGNQLLDALIGLVPFLGDLLDIAHKAHRRNLLILKAYYADPEPKPPIFWAVIVFCILFVGIIIGSFMLAKWVWALAWNSVSNNW